jgi:SAM-dependent methyltransferase
MRNIVEDTLITFKCNICGQENSLYFKQFHREAPSCSKCRSNPRFRGTMHALSVALFGKSITLVDFPNRKDIKGIGMSDWEVYSNILVEKFDFQNTYYHTAPKLDLKSDDWKNFTNCDFVLCTEVMEHVVAPLEDVLINVRRMLKPNGALIFTAPYTNRVETKEHFPGLFKFHPVEIDGQWVVLNKNVDGTYTVFDKDICFHGGPGTVLEMRVFSERDLKSLLGNAGFRFKEYHEAICEIGYVWPSYEERAGDGIGLNYIFEARPATSHL